MDVPSRSAVERHRSPRSRAPCHERLRQPVSADSGSPPGRGGAATPPTAPAHRPRQPPVPRALLAGTTEDDQGHHSPFRAFTFRGSLAAVDNTTTPQSQQPPGPRHDRLGCTRPRRDEHGWRDGTRTEDGAGGPGRATSPPQQPPRSATPATPPYRPSHRLSTRATSGEDDSSGTEPDRTSPSCAACLGSSASSIQSASTRTRFPGIVAT